MNRNRSVVAGAVFGVVGMAVGLVCPVAAQTAVTWEVKRSGHWIRNGLGVDFDDRKVSDRNVDLQLVERGLVCNGCTIAELPGGRNDFDRISAVPIDGYVDSLSVAATKLVIVRLADGRYAKLLVEAPQYDPASASPNGAGITVTYVLSHPDASW